MKISVKRQVRVFQTLFYPLNEASLSLALRSHNIICRRQFSSYPSFAVYIYIYIYTPYCITKLPYIIIYPEKLLKN